MSCPMEAQSRSAIYEEKAEIVLVKLGKATSAYLQGIENDV